MKIWYKAVLEKLRASGLFEEVNLIGAKVRASVYTLRRRLPLWHSPLNGYIVSNVGAMLCPSFSTSH